MILYDLEEAAYHGHQSLSSTGARRILKSPAKFRHDQDHPQPSTSAFDLGSAVHSKVLGVGWGIEELDFPDWRTKAAQQARDLAREAGLIPMLKKELVQVHAMAEAVLAHPTASALFEMPGAREVSIITDDAETGIAVRARFDFLSDARPGGRIAVDLKTTVDASPSGFSSSAASYRYDMQRAHYLRALKNETGELAEMVFCCVEKEPPYMVAIHQLDREFADVGVDDIGLAWRTYADCAAKDEWPGYPPRVNLVKPPMWLVYEHQDRHAAA